MKPWLEGDLTGVDARAEMSLLRDAVASASHRAVDLTRFWRALGDHDAAACAELAAGPRAVPHRLAVLGSLAASDAIETVLAPSGLYPRLVALSSDATEGILAHAAVRHPVAEWLWRLSRTHEVVPGHTPLSVLLGSDAFPDACAVAARMGGLAGLIECAAVAPDLEPVAALYRHAGVEHAGRAAAAALNARPTAKVVPLLAALHGPDLDPVLVQIVPHLTNPLAVDALRRDAGGFSGTVALLEGLRNTGPRAG